MRLQTPPFWAFFSQYVSVWYHIFFGDWFVLLLECAHTVMLVSDTLKQKHEPNNWIKLGESASVCICSVFWHRGWSIVKKNKTIQTLTVIQWSDDTAGFKFQMWREMSQTCHNAAWNLYWATTQCSGYSVECGIEPNKIQHPFPCMLQCGLVEQNNDATIATKFAQFL